MNYITSSMVRPKSIQLKNDIPESKNFISKIVDKFESTGKKIDEYTRPRFDPEKGIDTSGDMPESSALSGAIAAGLGSLASTGILGVPAGVIGAVAGVIAGEHGGFLAALIAGSLTGAATGAAVGAITGGPVGAAAMALAGAFSGAVGTLYGSSRASTKDGVFGGGIIGAAAMGAPGALLGAVAGGIGGKAVDGPGRAVLGAISGLIIGGALGAISGPVGVAVGAIKGALIGSGGAVLGPRVNQAIRNLQMDLGNYMDKNVDPHVKGIKLKKWQKVALGTLARALPLAYTGGIIFGPVGATIGAVIGGALGAKSILSLFKKKAQSPENNEQKK